jgi:hypothetical protein
MSARAFDVSASSLAIASPLGTTRAGGLGGVLLATLASLADGPGTPLVACDHL